MSALPLRLPHVPRPMAGIGRVISAIAMVVDVFAEAQQQAIAAHRRYPFADW